MDIIVAMSSSADNAAGERELTEALHQCAKIGCFLLFPALFSWRALASQYYILMSGFAGHIYSWLAIACQEIIVAGNETEWIQCKNRLNPLNPSQGAKIGCFMFACLFSIFGFVSIYT